MRLLRLGDAPSTVGADLRAALASWGRGDDIVGGVALLGLRPRGLDRVVDAVIVLPRGVLVVIGVDLPDPAVRLRAPLDDVWLTDGWPLVRNDGAVNPAVDAIAFTAAITRGLAERSAQDRAMPPSVATVVAVGPYVAAVEQPAADLTRGLRVLHPEPSTLLTAARELAVGRTACSIADARGVLAGLCPAGDLPADLAALLERDDELSREGFASEPPTVVTTPVALPRPTAQPPVPQPSAAPMPAPQAPEPVMPMTPAGRQRPPWTPAGTRGTADRPRLLPLAALALVVSLLVTGVVFALGSDDGGGPAGSPTSSAGPSAAVVVSGVRYLPKGTQSDADCAAHATGEVRQWLAENGCRQLVRMRFEATSAGRAAAVQLTVLRFAEGVLAAELRALVDRPDTGGIADLAAEGTPWPGGRQPSFAAAARASGQEGTSVKLVTAVWLDQPGAADDPLLVALARRGLDLTAPS